MNECVEMKLIVFPKEGQNEEGEMDKEQKLKGWREERRDDSLLYSLAFPSGTAYNSLHSQALINTALFPFTLIIPSSHQKGKDGLELVATYHDTSLIDWQ